MHSRCKSRAWGISGVVYHPYLTDQSTIDDLIKGVNRSECLHNSLDSDHIVGEKLRVRRKNFNYWPREARLKTINGEEYVPYVCTKRYEYQHLCFQKYSASDVFCYQKHIYQLKT